MGKTCVAISGTVASGRGNGRAHILANAAEIARLTCERTVFPGSLNVVLDRPLFLSNEAALRFADGKRLLWPGRIGAVPVWIYRWQEAPLHIVELVAPAKLRERLGVGDGDPVSIEIDATYVRNVAATTFLVWSLLWAGRADWPYTHGRYYRATKSAALLLGATQSEGGRYAVRDIAGRLYRRAKRIPVLGPAVARIREALRPAPPRYVFSRADADACDTAEERELARIGNVLDYTKTGGSAYSARQYPAGYHTLEIFGRRLAGQRDPRLRFRNLPLDLTGKRVLDLGTNQGGMLLCIRDEIRLGVGLDCDHRMVNAANRLAASAGATNLRFFVFDLEKEPLDLILDLVPGGRVDVVFLLSVCMWIGNWRAVIRFCAEHADAMVFESNGSDAQQREQETALRKHFGAVRTIEACSEDDPEQKRRKLLLCEAPVERSCGQYVAQSRRLDGAPAESGGGGGTMAPRPGFRCTPSGLQGVLGTRRR